MKKSIKFYLPCWAIALAVFNVITFAVPITVNVNKFTLAFWIGYTFITLMFIAQLVCSIVFFKQDNNDKKFLNIPIISLSYTALLVSIIFGAVAMAVPFIPYWAGIVLDVLIVAFYAIAIISSKAAADTIENIDKKVKAQTFFIRSLTVDAESLLPRAKSDETKAIAKKIYEAIRYSDPMSDEALSLVESQITIKFNEFSNAVIEDNKPLAETLGNELIILVNDRNKKCKILK
ncbi:hypothetical protein [Eubacterium sp.]